MVINYGSTLHWEWDQTYASAIGNMPMVTAEIGPSIPIILIRCQCLNRKYIVEVWCFIESIIKARIGLWGLKDSILNGKCLFSIHISVEEAQRYLRCKRRHARDEGREPADDERKESDHSGAVSLSPLPSASPHCPYSTVVSAAFWHQRCECAGRKMHTCWLIVRKGYLLWLSFCTCCTPVGLLLLHWYLWESWRRTACVCNHWSGCCEHSLYGGLGEFSTRQRKYMKLWLWENKLYLDLFLSKCEGTSDFFILF